MSRAHDVTRGLAHRIPIRKRPLAPSFLPILCSWYLSHGQVLDLLSSPPFSYLQTFFFFSSPLLFGIMQPYTLMYWLFIPFRHKETRLLFFAIFSSYTAHPSFTTELVKWMIFWELMVILVMVHFIVLIQLSILTETEIMDHVIHITFNWLRTLVNSQIQQFPHRYQLA